MKKKILGVTAIVAVIAMVACASLTIVSVDWDSLVGPSKTRQYLGVSSQEVTVFANYKDESRKEVTFLSVSHDRDRTGNQTVTVTVLGQGTGTFQTEVMEMTGIRVDRAPSKTSYTVGERADLAGIKVIGSWRDFPDAEVPAYQVTVASFDSSSAGNRVVTVDYKGKRATFPVTVTVPATPAPAASQPSQPAQQQPSTPAPSASTFNPAANQPAPTGTWTKTVSSGNNTVTNAWTFNANGTGRYIYSLNGSPVDLYGFTFTWTTSGNRLTYTSEKGTTSNYTYSISGNTLTWQEVGRTVTETFTRQ